MIVIEVAQGCGAERVRHPNGKTAESDRDVEHQEDPKEPVQESKVHQGPIAPQCLNGPPARGHLLFHPIQE